MNRFKKIISEVTHKVIAIYLLIVGAVLATIYLVDGKPGLSFTFFLLFIFSLLDLSIVHRTKVNEKEGSKVERKPRFKSERTSNLVLLIWKFVTIMFLTAISYPFILFLIEIEMTQITWLLYAGGMAAGVLFGKINLRGEVNGKMNRWIIFLSCLTIMLVVNILMNIEPKALITILGLLVGIPTYTSLKYEFSDLEKEIKNYYVNQNNKGYKRFSI